MRARSRVQRFWNADERVHRVDGVRHVSRIINRCDQSIESGIVQKVKRLNKVLRSQARYDTLRIVGVGQRRKAHKWIWYNTKPDSIMGKVKRSRQKQGVTHDVPHLKEGLCISAEQCCLFDMMVDTSQMDEHFKVYWHGHRRMRNILAKVFGERSRKSKKNKKRY